MSDSEAIMRKKCAVCDQPFEGKRASAKYCGERCKKRAQRAPGLLGTNVSRFPTAAGAEGPVTAATRAELESAGRSETALGQSALAIAKKLDDSGPGETGAGFRALVDGHRAALAEAMKDAEQERDALEDIRRSAALKLVSSG